MKRFTSFLLLPALLSGSIVLSAQVIRPLEDSRFEITAGANTLTVDAARGGKVLSFKHGDQEVISQLRWPNAFGSTFWTSPQAEWNWPPVPEYDSMPYTVDNQEGPLVLTGPVSEKYGYRIRKEFAADPADGAVVITYSIVNESGTERKVAPWEITRVPNGGVIFFDADPAAVTPAGLMPVRAADGAAWIDVDVANENRKVNIDGKGWFAFSDNGLVLVKRFQDLEAAEPAPKEAEIQVYINARKTYVELECQGPYTVLQPGEALTWGVRWYLVPAGEDLMGTVAPLLK